MLVAYAVQVVDRAIDKAFVQVLAQGWNSLTKASLRLPEEVARTY